MTQPATDHTPTPLARWAAWQTRLLWVFLLLAVVLRMNSYLINRSLWIDEAMLSLNILHAPFTNLFSPLAYYQIAPVGFLILEKALTSILGGSEFSLRLLPLLASLLAIPVFIRLCRQFLSARGTLIALLLLAICRPLVYYAAEVKQYATDVLFSTIFLLLFAGLLKKSANNALSFRDLILPALLGMTLLWFSHPIGFVISGCCIVLSGWLFLKKQPVQGLQTLVLWALCGLSWFAFYKLTLAPFQSSAKHQDIWDSVWDGKLQAFMPWNLTFFPWLADRLSDIMTHPVALPATWLSVPLFLLGIVQGLRTDPLQRSRTLLLLSPILLCLLASGIHIYPFIGRMLLFTVPVFLIFIALGMDTLLDALFSTHWKPFQPRLVPAARFTGLILLGILVLPPFFYRKLYQPSHEEIKPTLAYIQQHRQPGDRIYVYYGAQPAFQYYAERYNLASKAEQPVGGADYNDYITGLAQRGNPAYPYQLLGSRLAPLLKPGERLWVVFSHRHGKDEANLLELLSHFGTPTDTFEAKGTGTTLFTLNPAAAE